MGLGLATKAFWKILFDADAAAAYQGLLDGKTQPQPQASAADAEAKPAVTTSPKRSEAIGLLAALQRESRLLDLIQEPLDEFSDEQVGAAARSVLRDASQVVDRMFAIRPVAAEDEGAELETPAEVDPSRYRLSGNVSGSAPFRGTIVHRGWEATKCEVPTWSGNASSAKVVAPIEIELP